MIDTFTHGHLSGAGPRRSGRGTGAPDEFAT